MTTRIRTALDKIVSTLEGVTADTRYNGTTAFRHAETAYSSEDIDPVRGATRLVLLALTGSSTVTGPIGGITEPMDSEETVDLLVVYPMGKHAFELMKVIAEDHIKIRYNLMKPANWSSGVMRQVIQNYAIDTADDEDGGAAVVSIPISFRYRPQFN